MRKAQISSKKLHGYIRDYYTMRASIVKPTETKKTRPIIPQPRGTYI